jgi:hypothetical protein
MQHMNITDEFVSFGKDFGIYPGDTIFEISAAILNVSARVSLRFPQSL